MYAKGCIICFVEPTYFLVTVCVKHFAFIFLKGIVHPQTFLLPLRTKEVIAKNISCSENFVNPLTSCILEKKLFFVMTEFKDILPQNKTKY